MCFIPSDNFDWILFGHDLIEPWVNVRELLNKLILNAFDYRSL